MSDDTKIQWEDASWNPVTGCTKISQGCKNCYAERLAERFWGERKFTDVQLHPERLKDPLHWKKPRRVFVNSMSDLFHEDVPIEFVKDVWTVMLNAPQHTFHILTKRPNRMMEAVDLIMRDGYGILKNVWTGVSVEDQKAADERIPLLLQTPAAVRFVSCEPLLEPVSLYKLRYGDDWHWDSLRGFQWRAHYRDYQAGTAKLDWVIVGGESGPNARPMHPDWAQSIRDQCLAAGVPFFFKQWGEWYPSPYRGSKSNHGGFPYDPATGTIRPGKKATGRLLDGREWNEYPEVNNERSSCVC